MSRGTFLVAAPDQVGLVARLAGFFAERGLNIVDASNHTDGFAAGGPRFFMRLAVDLGERDKSEIARAFDELVRGLGGAWSVGYSDERPRVALLVSREPACLYDLVLRQRSGELACEIPLVISNHELLREAAASFSIPFHHLAIEGGADKREQERAVRKLLDEERIDLVVLARYMQILSPEFLESAPPIINIHHAFLPSFQGARPYHQAHERGVKMIGATAHYVTSELDEGPIIEQDTARVTHEMGPDELQRVGRDVERVVLARAVRAHLERRILVEGRRTILL